MCNVLLRSRRRADQITSVSPKMASTQLSYLEASLKKYVLYSSFAAGLHCIMQLLLLSSGIS